MSCKGPCLPHCYRCPPTVLVAANAAIVLAVVLAVLVLPPELLPRVLLGLAVGALVLRKIT